MQGALPPAPPASPRNSRGATPCQAINFDIFRHIERECSQGFKGGEYQQGHRENRRATCSEAFQRLGDGALRSGFRIILAETAERKTESFLFRRRRRNNPKKREVKGFEGWRFPQGNTTPYLDFSLAWYALPIERLFVPEVALRVGACGA